MRWRQPTNGMPSRAEIERLRLEADTILTRYQQVEQRLEAARTEDGEQWETGELTVTLETPQGDSITVTLDFDGDPASNAQWRYDRANELEAELERKESVVEQLQPLPADPLAYLVCYHLDHVEGNYPKSMAGHLDAQRGHVEDLCKEMETAGLLERIESGTVKQRNVKAKQADEVRQHHTYYRLSREGDHLLRFLAERTGQLNVLRHLPDAQRLLEQLTAVGPASPRLTADEWEMEFEYVRHLYRALRQIGLVTEHEGETPAQIEQTGQSSEKTSHKHTYYAPTSGVAELLQSLEE